MGWIGSRRIGGVAEVGMGIKVDARMGISELAMLKHWMGMD